MTVKGVALALALMTSLVSLAEPADKTVWRVGVFDGSSGEFAGGDMVAAFHPAYAHAEVEVDFPRSWLKTGTNSIFFQAVPASDKIVPHAGFAYDGIELQQADRVPTAISAHAEPTIFFQKHGASIDERVDVFVRYGERSGRVELAITGHTFASRSTPIRSSEKSVFLSRLPSSHPGPRPILLWL